MARFGTWKPLSDSWAAQPKMTQVDIVSVHTMVGSLVGTDSMFRGNGYGGTFSHFGVGGDGSCTQWQDTAYRAAANLNGNWHIISVECADVGAPFAAWNLNDGSAVPAFTDAQCETLAQLIAVMCKAHNIPCELIPDAKPGRRGIGWHRLGVPGYMVAGAEQWSTATGKVCPGNRRIAQIPGIVARAQAILAGLPEEDMPLTKEDIAAVSDAVANRAIGASGAAWQTWNAAVAQATAAAAAANKAASSADAASKAIAGFSTAPVNVDAASVAASLAGNATFLAALAKAVNDDASARLKA